MTTTQLAKSTSMVRRFRLPLKADLPPLLTLDGGENEIRVTATDTYGNIGDGTIYDHPFRSTTATP